MNTEMKPPVPEPGVPAVSESEAGGYSHGADLNVTLVATVGIVAAISLFVLIVGIQAWFFAYRADEQELKTVPNQMLVEQTRLQQNQLEGIASADVQLRNLRIPGVVPINEAMDRVVQRYASAAIPAGVPKR